MKSSRKLGYIAALLAGLALYAQPIPVHAATPLIDLYEKVERGATETRQRDEQREARFASSAQEKARTLEILSGKSLKRKKKKTLLKTNLIGMRIG